MAILTGRLAGGVVLGLAQTLVFLGIGVAFGAQVQAGPVGVLAILALAALLATAVGGLGVVLALRTGSAEAVQGAFPLFFVLLFFSSALLPARDHDRLVPDRGRHQPDLAPGRGDARPGDRRRRPGLDRDRRWRSPAGWRSWPSRRAGGRSTGKLGRRMSHAARVSMGLAWRSLILVRRMPSVFIPSLVMPLFILVSTAGAFRGIAALPALDGVDYTAFTIPLATVMGAGFAGANAGLTMARDIEGGFVDRLVASPAPRVTLIAGPLVAAAARSVITTTVVLIAGLVAGVGLPGVAGTLVVYLMALGFGAAAACWTMGVALRARTVQSAPLMQVVIFMSIFTSVAYAPREVLERLAAHHRRLEPGHPGARDLAGGRARDGHLGRRCCRGCCRPRDSSCCSGPSPRSAWPASGTADGAAPAAGGGAARGAPRRAADRARAHRRPLRRGRRRRTRTRR